MYAIAQGVSSHLLVFCSSFARIDIAFLLEKLFQFWKKVWIDLEVQFFYVTNFLYLRFLAWELREFKVNNIIQLTNHGKEKNGQLLLLVSGQLLAWTTKNPWLFKSSAKNLQNATLQDIVASFI